MNQAPLTLTPEAAAWVQAQIAISTARAVAPLREELDKVDDWANGLFVVLADVLPLLLKDRPAIAEKVAPKWASASQRFGQLQHTGLRRTDAGESLEQLEARKMLFRVMDLLGAWPKPTRNVPK